MKKTVLEKDNKYNKKKTKNLKVLGVATIYTLALSIGLSAAAFALFNKLKNIELPTETPVESVTPTETVIPTEEPTETITPTETPIESNVPTETPTPTPTETKNIPDYRYDHDVNLFGPPIIAKIEVDGVKKFVILNVFIDQVDQVDFFVDYFSQRPLFYWENLSETGICAFKGKKIELIDLSSLDKTGAERVAKIYGFDKTKYTKVRDIYEWYIKSFNAKERLNEIPYLDTIAGMDDIKKYNEEYNGYIYEDEVISNSNTDYTNNVTLSASSKESLNNKLIASGLLKQDSNTNIVDYQKILQKRA